MSHVFSSQRLGTQFILWIIVDGKKNDLVTQFDCYFVLSGSYVHSIRITCSFPQGICLSFELFCSTISDLPNLSLSNKPLQVWEKSGYNTVEWVRYITKAGSYEVRC